MATLENRFIRIEDWKGNTYFPETNSGASTSGVVISGSSASTDPDDFTYTQGNVVVDSTANNGLALEINSASITSKSILFRTYFSDTKFGNVAINARMKSSDGTSEIPLVEINAYITDKTGQTSDPPFSSTVLTGKDFKIANEFVNFGAVINYKGSAAADGSGPVTMLKIEFVVRPETGAVIRLDQLAVAMEMSSASGGGANVEVDGRTVIFEE